MFQVDPVKLYISLIYREEPARTEAKELMIRRWGAIESESDPVPYNPPDKLKEEMGIPLFRTFISFQRLIDPGEISLVKMGCIGLEERLRHQGKRLVNLDPGYVDSSKAIITTTHGGPAKLYHSAGIYLDMVLLFPKGKCQALPWSLPDFKAQTYDETFQALHTVYKTQLAATKSSMANLAKKQELKK